MSVCAASTPHHGRLEVKSGQADEIAALVAPAIVSVFDTPDRRLESPDSSMATRFLGRRHGLLLHSVHSAEAADTLLVELDRSAVGCRLRRGGPQLLQLRSKAGQKRSLKLFRCGVGHANHRKSRTGTLQERIISVVVEPMTRLRMRL
jgi:hypothetical protein